MSFAANARALARAARALIAGAVCATAIALPAHSADVTLKAGTFLPPVDKVWYPFIAGFLDRVNERGGTHGLEAKMVAAGFSAMNPFQMGNAVKTGVLDVVHLPGTYYNRIVPLADAQKLSTLTATEQRKNGTFAFLEPIYNEKMNVHYLGRWADKVNFHFYLNKKIDKPDLTGLTIRGTSVYQAFIEAMGGKMVTTPPGDAYTAIERGVVDGYGWPLWGIEPWGWHKVTKYRVEPGFYWSEISILVNLDTWKKLSQAQQEVLTEAAIHLETNFEAVREEHNQKERAFQAASGIEVIEFKGADRERFLKMAEEAGWADVMEKDPVNGPKIRALTAP